MKDYKTFAIDRKEQVATITLMSPPYPAGENFYWDLGCVFNELREDNGIRVIVLTGSGGNFTLPAPNTAYDDPAWPNRNLDPRKMWQTFTGIVRMLQGMAEIEKPIIAKVNGDAIAFGSSLAFSCDFIIAREDAIIADNHMGETILGNYNGVQKAGGYNFSMVPGDGGLSLIPLFMSPCKAKEYLMLSQPFTAAELARLGIINYAVPAAELDAKVEDFVQRLLKLGPYTVARTKRVINRKLVDHLNLTLDSSVAYEMVSLFQTMFDPERGAVKPPAERRSV